MPIPRPERFLITLALGGLAAGAGKKLRNLFPTRPAEFLLYEKSV
jgi:hypothetical protein